ncbi:hypothetical protein N9452_04420 [Alphaproteobacteria bacterium]|nr:hypothetical protein [Alphaproteobacteria bacterium]
MATTRHKTSKATISGALRSAGGGIPIIDTVDELVAVAVEFAFGDLHSSEAFTV